MRRSMVYVAAFLILAGLTLLVRSLFRLHFGVFSALFAEAIILLGIYLITGGGARGFHIPASSSTGSEENIFFTTRNILGSAQTARYSVFFSSARIELPEDAPDIVEIASVFSSVHVVLPKGRAVRVKLSAAFASGSMPGTGVSGFGDREAFIGEGPAFYLEAGAVFGSVSIE